MEDFSIERVGIKNLDFTGELIGQSAAPTSRIKIYRTKGLKFIGEVKVNQKMSNAQHCDTPTDLIVWFKNSSGAGGITPEIEDAIEDATKHDDGFKAAWNEHVD